MAHFAQIDENNIVTRVLVVDNSVLDNNGTEDESLGKQHLVNLHGGTLDSWIQTSYNTIENTHAKSKTPFRGNYAGKGFTWDSTNQVFIPPKIYASFVLDTTNWKWDPPIPVPALGTEKVNQNDAGTHSWHYNWDEDAYQADNTQGWVLVNDLV